jgi:AcrR family transcriptional regulator
MYERRSHIVISGYMNIVQDKNEHRSRRPATLVRRSDLAARLTDLAESAISTIGVQDLRARALADAAGCSVGAIYTVFPDLDELILAVNGRTLDAIDAAMTLAAQGAPTPEAQMESLASRYLDYATNHRGRWNALFQHRMAGARAVPDWYAARLAAAFTHIEAPIHVLQPELDKAACAQFARTVFSAVHGVVELGLGGKTMTPPDILRVQLRKVVAAIARGSDLRG